MQVLLSSAQQLTSKICLVSYYRKLSEMLGDASKMLNIIRERMGNILNRVLEMKRAEGCSGGRHT